MIVYMVPGSLADQVTYPRVVAKADRTPALEEKLLDLLRLVGIEYLLERWAVEMADGGSGWDYITSWEDVLRFVLKMMNFA